VGLYWAGSKNGREKMICSAGYVGVPERIRFFEGGVEIHVSKFSGYHPDDMEEFPKNPSQGGTVIPRKVRGWRNKDR
jgi:hypothetical protein